MRFSAIQQPFRTFAGYFSRRQFFEPGGYLEIWRIAWPLIILSASNTIMMLTNRIFIANDSPEEIAAAMPAGQMFFTLMAFFLITTSFTATVIAQFHGANDRVGCVQAAWNGFYFGTIVAVLLTFENTHRSTYFEAREILKRFRWHAAMGVVGDLVRTHNEDSILLPYLKDMNLDMAWDLASESHLGTTTIPASPTGARELFFAAPQWIAASNRFERFEEFTQRINTDHETSVGDFKQNFGAAPLAFFFPKGNYGQFQEYNRGLREANLRAVEKHYPLAFLLNQHAYNDKGTDHRRLNRLEIPADWTPEQLLHRLNISWPVQTRRGQRDSAIETSRWIQDWGLLDNLGSYVTIRARPPADPIRTHSDATYGGRAWIAEPGRDIFHHLLEELPAHGLRHKRICSLPVSPLTEQEVPVPVTIWELAK